MKRISMFRNAFDNTGVEVALNDVLFTAKYKERVFALREITDPEEYNKAKRNMPMFTVSGVFDIRSRNGLREHSGMICLDIDGKQNPNLNIEKFIQSMRYVDVVYFAGYSIGGNGCFVIIPIAEPENHELHFDALVKDFAGAGMGVKIDASCRDVSRSRFVSYNPNPYFNPQAKVYDKIILPKPKQRVSYTNVQSNIGRLADKVVQSGVNITIDYKDWFALACSLRGVQGGREMFHSLSSMDSRYTPAETEYQFDAVDANGGYDERKFFEICKRHGVYLYEKALT
ncbi:MAG: BT4734/BF3469 family protein [Bacteroidia bacterium]|nr:BT4734/BF3469 family protein [Bacteroidia bacterium]